MNSFLIYVVDDEKSVRLGITFSLKKQYQVKSFPDAETAIDAIGEKCPDLVLLDIGLPGMSGIQALKKIKEINPEIIVIMVTAYEDIDSVISVMKSGARDYVLKPIRLDSLKNTIQNALETIKLRKEIQKLQENHIRDNLPCFIGESQAIQDVMKFVNKVAKSADIPILITGESGTGKELIAQAIHYKSPNFQGPFVAVNCAAIPQELIESELFGYERGAFSGARTSGKEGLLQQATGGTLFLDEIGDLNIAAQAKLLRFLEAGEFYKVGGTQPYKIKTRVVSATNKDLSKMIDEKEFRIDLYHRLAAIKLKLPTLNERPDDILPIARFFLVASARKYKKPFNRISPAAEIFLQKHKWHGNVRELKHIIERAVLVGQGPELMLEDLGINQPIETATVSGFQTSESSPFPPLPSDGIDLDALETHYIREAYQKAEKNDRTAAKLLKMSYYAFRYRKKKIQDLHPGRPSPANV